MYQLEETRFGCVLRKICNNTIVQGIIHFIAACFMPFIVTTPAATLTLLQKLYYIVSQTQVIIFFAVYVVLLIIFHVAKQSTLKIEKSNLIVHKVKQELEATITCMETYIRNDKKKTVPIVFDDVAQMVCNSLHEVLSKYAENISFRTRVVKQYLREDKKYYYCISGYKSDSHNMSSAQESLVCDCNQHTKEILECTSQDYDILVGEKELAALNFKKTKHKKKQLKVYIAIPYNIGQERPCFVIEADSTDKKAFGRNKESIRCFINDVIQPFTKTITSI